MMVIHCDATIVTSKETSTSCYCKEKTLFKFSEVMFYWHYMFIYCKFLLKIMGKYDSENVETESCWSRIRCNFWYCARRLKKSEIWFSLHVHCRTPRAPSETNELDLDLIYSCGRDPIFTPTVEGTNTALKDYWLFTPPSPEMRRLCNYHRTGRC